MAALTALPHARPQWRDQYPPRQCQLDARPRGRTPIRWLGHRYRTPQADHPARRLGLRGVGQRRRSPRHVRPLDPARHDHARAAGLALGQAHAAGAPGVLRLPPLHQRAVGRSRRALLQRRHHRRRLPRPQRPAPRALQADRRRHLHHRLRSRHHPLRRRAHRRKGPPRSRRNDRHRHGGRQTSARRGDQGLARRPQALWPMGAQGHLIRLSELAKGTRQGTRRTARYPHADPAPDGVRLFQRGSGNGAQADGGQCLRSRWLHGRRHSARRPLASAPTALHLLQAALRPGHESAHRPDPREARHVAQRESRLAAQSPRRDPRARPAGPPNRPCFFPNELATLRNLADKHHPSATIDCTWPLGEGEEGLGSAIDRICARGGSGGARPACAR